MKTWGQHLLSEYFDCDPQVLDDLDAIERLVRRAAEAAGATVVTSRFHRFAPHGVTGVVVVEESHLAVHTWPEERYAAADFYTCGKIHRPEIAHEVLRDGLDADAAEVMLLHRGTTTPGPRIKLRSHYREFAKGTERYDPDV